MADHPLRYRDLLRIVHRYGVDELPKRRGKGSERILIGVVNGRRIIHTIRCHNEGEVKYVPVVKAVRRAFNLTATHGISDREFYSR